MILLTARVGFFEFPNVEDVADSNKQEGYAGGYPDADADDSSIDD